MIDDIGIPYAYNYEVVDMDGAHVAWVVRCPECGVFIEEQEMKDFESHTGREYADHYRDHHSICGQDYMAGQICQLPKGHEGSHR